MRYGLAIGGYCAPFVLVVMYLLGTSRIVALVLDYLIVIHVNSTYCLADRKAAGLGTGIGGRPYVS